MGKLDSLKEEIGWLKVTFSLLVAVDVSLLAWIVQNYDTANTTLVFAGGVAIMLVSGAICWVNSVAYRCIDELEDN